MCSARWTVQISWKCGQAGLKGSTAIHEWISTCNVAEELKMTGTNKWMSGGCDQEEKTESV